MPTHEVTNQAPPLEDYNIFETDPLLGEAVAAEGGEWGLGRLSEFGSRVGSAEVIGWGFDANRHPPVLHTHDRTGERLDQVEYHPSYHRLMGTSLTAGLHGLHWEDGAPDGSQVLRTALFSMMAQVEAGHGCPVSMTAAVVPALAAAPRAEKEWRPRLVSRKYDPRFLPAENKTGSLMGMGMTEKQGGSDVRANTTRAEPVDGGHRITGHKWFTSAPMCDAFLILAQAPGGLSCFLLPRFDPDGGVNTIRLHRLKDKLGNRSNASSEIEFERAHATLIGEEGRGIATIIEMVNGTRLDCVSGSVGLMRQALAQAGWHVAHRSAFGSKLIDKPLMRNVLADLEVEVEAATLMMVRLAGAFDRAPHDPAEEAFRRLATPVAKYWVTKRATPVIREAMECIAGNGYVEESILPRLFRESPLNAIWEGSGNVIALDVLRAIGREPGAVAAFRDELVGHDVTLDVAVSELGQLMDVPDPERNARRIVERMAVIWAAALLFRAGRDDAGHAYCQTRVSGDGGALFGTLPSGVAVEAIANRAVPQV